MQFYDIFNGDADGICALQQLRIEDPRPSVLVTGAKREIDLVARVTPGAGDELTVLDLSFKVNAHAVANALECGARCRYFDHHAAGDVPQHPNLRTFIDTAPDVCTSLIVDRYLSGRQRIWAVVAAFGDNLIKSALRTAELLELEEREVQLLRELGEALNYNAYGDTVDDLHYHPADLFETLSHYRDPRDFVEAEPIFDVLRNAWQDDLARARNVAPERETAGGALYVLPDAAWSRRISGLFANQLAQEAPARAHAVLVKKPEGYSVSVRAALEKPVGAEALCAKYETGGGRKAAAGINHLPEGSLSDFITEFSRAFT